MSTHPGSPRSRPSRVPASCSRRKPSAPPDPNRRILALKEFRLESGAVLPVANVAYATFGTLNAAKDNAVLVPSYYGADYHGYDFLIGPGKALDPARYFVVATEMFGNGFSSSPSNTPAPHAGPDFPAIAIRDNVEASRRVLEHLGVTHVRAVAGFSMGAEQAFQWAVSHPTFMDGIVPWCGTAKTYPHGVVRLESAIRALTADPAFAGGRYTSPPKAGMAAWSTHWAAWVWSQEWWRRELFKPQSATVEQALATRIARDSVRDPNNLILHARTWQQHNVGDTRGLRRRPREGAAVDHGARALHAVRDRLVLPDWGCQVRAAVPQALDLHAHSIAVGPLGGRRRQSGRCRLHQRTNPRVSRALSGCLSWSTCGGRG